MNALYYNLRHETLKDPTGLAIRDLMDRKLRFVGKPKDRLKEDMLRAWRFFRFIDKGFEPDMKSLRAVREMWSEVYEKSNPQRVLSEIEKMVKL